VVIPTDVVAETVVKCVPPAADQVVGERFDLGLG